VLVVSKDSNTLEIILEKQNQTAAFPCHEVIEEMVRRLARVRHCESFDELLSLGFNGKVIKKEVIPANLCDVGDREFYYIRKHQQLAQAD